MPVEHVSISNAVGLEYCQKCFNNLVFYEYQNTYFNFIVTVSWSIIVLIAQKNTCSDQKFKVIYNDNSQMLDSTVTVDCVCGHRG